MTTLGAILDLDRCPHCNVDKPNLRTIKSFTTVDYEQSNPRYWRAYVCERCGGAVMAHSNEEDGWVYASNIFPTSVILSDQIPDPAKAYLQQAIDSVHSPAGSVMLSASAVDAMLKAKSLTKGRLNERIDAAATHIITEDMSLWAHSVRLDANEPRHADEANPLPDGEDAKRSIDFALA